MSLLLYLARAQFTLLPGVWRARCFVADRLQWGGTAARSTPRIASRQTCSKAQIVTAQGIQPVLVAKYWGDSSASPKKTRCAHCETSWFRGEISRILITPAFIYGERKIFPALEFFSVLELFSSLDLCGTACVFLPCEWSRSWHLQSWDQS